MRLKAGAELWMEEHLKEARKFLLKPSVENEKELLQNHKIKGTKHKFEILPLKCEKPGFTEFLSLLSLEGRLLYLSDANHTLLTYEELQDILKVGPKKISTYFKNKNKLYELDFIEKLAVILKVPTHWITEERVRFVWENQYLVHLKDADYSISRFNELLLNVTKYTRDVKGIRLHIGKYLFCIRLEILFGAVLIEVLYHNAHDEVYNVLNNVFQNLKLQFGTFRTVIPNRLHPGLYSLYRAQEVICLPIEFNTHAAD